jgi:hypothetical protein
LALPLPSRPVWMHDLRTIPDSAIHTHRTVYMVSALQV